MFVWSSLCISSFKAYFPRGNCKRTQWFSQSLSDWQSNGSFFVCAFEHILRNSCLKFIRKDAFKEAKALLKLMFLPKLICLPNKTNLFWLSWSWIQRPGQIYFIMLNFSGAQFYLCVWSGMLRQTHQTMLRVRNWKHWFLFFFTQIGLADFILNVFAWKIFQWGFCGLNVVWIFKIYLDCQLI